MIATMQLTVIDCPDARALGAFYQGILGGVLDASNASWVTLTAPGGTRFAFQEVPFHRPPRWPDPEHPQQLHLDFEVPTRADVERARKEVLALGAAFLHDSGGERSGFLVFADPAGHPFCLCYGQLPPPPAPAAG